MESEPNHDGIDQISNEQPKLNNGKVKLSIIDDPWAIQDMESTTVPWKELTDSEKVKRVVISIAKFVAVLTLLYFFICSLDCMSTGFQLVSGSAATDIFKKEEFKNNKIIGVMLGIITTVLVQSSSTSTSIVVTMVASGILDTRTAIPIIMGANVVGLYGFKLYYHASGPGTSITNTIVSLTQAGDRNQFRRAFAGATVHDMFNWLTVIVLLIIEVSTGFLYELTTWITNQTLPGDDAGSDIKLLSVLTDPLVDLIVKINETTLDCMAQDGCVPQSTLLLSCGTREVPKSSLGIRNAGNAATDDECNFLFAYFGLTDEISGAVLLVCSLVVLCGCLILIVKVLQSVMKGQMANIIRKTINAKIPYAPWLTGYLALGVGAVITFLVQSSSVFTSTLTPLVGLGVISVERVYPLTLGSNIGTTSTALLAALSGGGHLFKASLQIALCHLFFNVVGILLFYPIPFMRFPIGMAKFLGETTAKYRWFAIAYMIGMFVVLPAVTLGLTLANPTGEAVIVLASILLLIFATILIINAIRKRRPSWLPEFLQSWKFLPIWLRSLEPYDQIFTRCLCCKKLKNKNLDPSDVGDHENDGFEQDDQKNRTTLP